MSDSKTLRLNGTDMIVSASVRDEDGNAVTAGQTVKFNIKRLSDMNWWNTGTSDFDLGAEPALITAPQDGTTGIYRLTLTGGFNNSSTEYQIHTQSTGVIVQDFSDDYRITNNFNDSLAEPAQGLPPVTASLFTFLQWFWTTWRNKSTETATIQKIENDAGTVLAKRPTQSDDGTTFTNSKFVSGP